MDASALQQRLFDWYEENARDLPWRNTTDPYRILVSEIMLQQTQVSRVIPKYEAFLDEFPTVQDLADAPLKDVIALWDGLGYNNRARYLKEAAEQVVAEYDGEFPRDPDELQELMGVGPYTANAVASFAFDSGGPVFDTNVRRVLYRFHGKAGDDELQAFLATIFPEDEPRLWNNALMELGSEVCTDGTPRCRECPWREDCTAWKRTDFATPDIQEQSTFEGSWRQYRAKLLKLLMDGPRGRDALRDDLDLPDDHDLDELIAELADEGMVAVDGDTVRLPG